MTTPPLAPPGLVTALRDQAHSLGFDLFGIAPAVSPEGYSRLVRWVELGYAAEMNYFADRLAAYADPGAVLAGAASVIVMTYPYPAAASSASTNRPSTDGDAESLSSGIVARYARLPADYHDIIHPLLRQMTQTIRQACPEAEVRGVVDTAPLMEREFATLAGLGWAGKNSLLLHKDRGSYFLLASILTTLVLPYDQPHSTSHCGTCTRCIEACPTEAFAAPGVVDSRRCISYLTIEHRGSIPLSLRVGVGDRLFGCDICQEVCPWNAKAERRRVSDRVQRDASVESENRQSADGLPERIALADLLAMDEAAFREAFRHTPLWRPRRRGLLRNAAICAGNAKDRQTRPVLVGLLDDLEPLVRGAAAWALGQIGGADAALRHRLTIEDAADVIDELQAALAQRSGKADSVDKNC